MPEIHFSGTDSILIIQKEEGLAKEERSQALLKILRLSHLPPSERSQVEKLLLEFQNIFFLPGDILKSEIKRFHKINPYEDSRPIYVKNYRFPEIHKKEVEKWVTDLLKQDVITKSQSPWNAPIWIVPKKSDASGMKKWRIVVDYRKLNQQTIPDRYPIPNIGDIFDSLSHAKYFTTLDLAQGFHQIPIKPEDREKTAFQPPGPLQIQQNAFWIDQCPLHIPEDHR